MAAAKRGRKTGNEDVHGTQACFRSCILVLAKVWIACGRPSIHAFFLWSGVSFLVCGLTTVITRDGAQDFFCTLPAQSEFGGVGCANTPSNLLACPKPSCYRSALNITYKVKSHFGSTWAQDGAAAASDSLYESFMDASTDVECNNIIGKETVTNPILALVEMEAAASGDQAVAQSCIDYHCGVLVTALTDGDLASSSGTCTNRHDSKLDSQANSCICQELLTYAGFQASELATSTSTGTSTAMQAIYNQCGTLVTLKMQGMCTWESYPIWCQSTTSTVTVSSTTATSTATTSTGTKTATSVTATTSSATTTASTLTTTTSVTTTATTLTITSATTTVSGLRRLDSEHDPFLTQSFLEMVVHPVEAARRLQTSASATSSSSSTVDNADLPDYEAGDWSPCTCYQQCTPGVRTRVVECLTTACQEPMPATREACICDHAAECSVDTRLIVLFSVFFTQAFIAVLCFIFYFRALSQSSDDFIKMGVMKRCGGFFFKQMPPLLRILVLIQLVQILWLVLDVWVFGALEDSGYQSDCWESKDLRLVSAICLGLWIFQVSLGKCTKTYARKPDWLYAPDRLSRRFPFKQFRIIFRCLGP